MFVVTHTGQKVNLLPQLRGRSVHKTEGHLLKVKQNMGSDPCMKMWSYTAGGRKMVAESRNYCMCLVV